MQDLRFWGEQNLNVEAIRESPLHLVFNFKDCVSPNKASEGGAFPTLGLIYMDLQRGATFTTTLVAGGVKMTAGRTGESIADGGLI